MKRVKLGNKLKIKFSIVLILLSLVCIIIAIDIMLEPHNTVVYNGVVTISDEDFDQVSKMNLDGQWEFYWDQLLISEDFNILELPVDSYVKVPETWYEQVLDRIVYKHHGVATYRLQLNYPVSIQDPAISVKGIATAYKLYANGKLLVEVGKVSENPSDFMDAEKSLVIALPNDTQSIELIFQVANLNYANGGIKHSILFGSEYDLAQEKTSRISLQLLIIGSVLIFGVYYLVLFLLQPKNKTALFFSFLCLITALRSLMWGEQPIMIFFPNTNYDMKVMINYITGINLIPSLMLFVLSIYPLEHNKTILRLLLLPTVIFDVLLLLVSKEFLSGLSSLLYISILLQLGYIIYVLIKAVIKKGDNAKLMYCATWIFILTIIQDILYNENRGGLDIGNMFIYGNIVVLMAMSYVQAKQQARTQQKLILYNENLIEADRLKNKIISTEMSFLQAQIKPHFLYNALDAIANVCEKDGKQAGNLILDLAIYLRGSLEFNNLDKMVTLEKELEFVDTYFNIEQARFGEKIQLQTDIDVPLNYQIPILILQPLVENAVRHGISKAINGGTVYVRVKEIHQGICIEIEDDGVGIEPNMLSTLLVEGDTSGVGLINIHSRLLKIYGSGLHISSKKGQTIIKVNIFKERLS
jgi:signal transduction histidine kinase